MKQNAQTNLTFGIAVATIVAAGGAYFAFGYLSGSDKKAAAPATAVATPAVADTASTNTVASNVADAAVAAVATDGNSTNLTAEEARKIGEEVARQVATQVAQGIVDQQLAKGGSGATTGGLSAAEAEQIGMSAGRHAAEEVAASTARAVVLNEFGGKINTAVAATSGSASTQLTSAEPSVAKQKSPDTSASANSHPRHTLNAKHGKSAPLPSDALQTWWLPASDGFDLLYAGQPKGANAIALLFSAKPSDGALNQQVKVYDRDGKLVNGNWVAGTNPRLAVLSGLNPGRYTVVVGATLADASGKIIGKPLHGPVYIR